MSDYVRTNASMRCSELEQRCGDYRNEIVSDWHEFIKTVYNETYNRSILEYIINTKIQEIVNKIICLHIPVTIYVDDEKHLLNPEHDFSSAKIELSIESDGTMNIEPNDSAKLLFQALGITQE